MLHIGVEERKSPKKLLSLLAGGNRYKESRIDHFGYLNLCLNRHVCILQFYSDICRKLSHVVSSVSAFWLLIVFWHTYLGTPVLA